MKLNVGDTFSNDNMSIVYTHSELDWYWKDNEKDFRKADRIEEQRHWFKVPAWDDGEVGVLDSLMEAYLEEKQLTKENK